MGGKFSSGHQEPIPNFGEDLGYMAMVLRSSDLVRMIHAPNSIIQTVQKIVA